MTEKIRDYIADYGINLRITYKTKWDSFRVYTNDHEGTGGTVAEAIAECLQNEFEWIQNLKEEE